MAWRDLIEPLFFAWVDTKPTKWALLIQALSLKPFILSGPTKAAELRRNSALVRIKSLQSTQSTLPVNEVDGLPSLQLP